MASRVRFEWNGDDLTQRLFDATVAAVDDTIDESALDASQAHEWHNRTGYLERHVITEAAHVEGDRIVGRFGATYSGQKGVRSGFYALFLEYKHPWLRPAADRHFPNITGRIARRFRGRS